MKDDPWTIWTRIHSQVNRMIKDSSVDRENMVGDVFLWFLVHPLYVPSGRVIRWRILDRLKSLSRIHEVEGYLSNYRSFDPPPVSDSNEVLDDLIHKALLDNRERKILYYSYVKGLSSAEIGDRMDEKGSFIGRVLLDIKKKLLKASRG